MRALESTLMRTFGRPTGTLGKLGGLIMARTNAAFARSVISLLEVQPTDQVLEVGFGAGVGIQLLANLAPAGRVAGVDCSREMLQQARVRNAEAIERGVVDLRLGSAEKLPFEDGAFDAVLAINSMQVWQDVMAGLRDLGRVTRSGGRVALGFTPYFRAVQGRHTGTALRCWFRRSEHSGDEARILRFGTKAVMAVKRATSIILC